MARLNKTVECDFCELQVNPHIISMSVTLTIVQCPNCGKEIHIAEDASREIDQASA